MRQRQREPEMLFRGSSSKVSVGDGMGIVRSRVVLLASAMQTFSLQKATSPKQLTVKRPSSGLGGRMHRHVGGPRRGMPG